MSASDTRSGSTGLQSTLLTLCLLAGFALNCALFRSFTSDDSYITFRYAHNAAAGLGLAFNPGEVVEGYSNPLWLGLLTLGEKTGVSLPALSKVLGLLAGLAALLFALGLIQRLTDGRDWRASLGLLPLITSAPLAVYAMSGLETVLYGAFITGVAYCWAVPTLPAWWAVTLCALAAALTRPEGIAILAVVLVWRVIRREEVPPKLQRHLWLSGAFIAAALAIFFAARWQCFQCLLPNTYYAKPPGAFGGASLLAPLTYLRDFLLDTGGWVWLGLSLWLLVVPRFRSLGVLALLLIGVEVALVVHARGDWMALHRFLVPVLPLLAACGYAALLRLKPATPVLAGLLTLLVVLNGVQVAKARESFRQGVYPYNVMAGQPQIEAGNWLRNHFPPQTVLACKRIGGLSYASEMRMVDTLGLVDRRIALIRHSSPERGEAEEARIAEEVFSRRPDLILLAVMKRWDKVPLDQPPPDVASNLRDVDNAIYAGLASHGYRFIHRLPQGGDGELAIYAREGFQGQTRERY